MPLTIEIDGIGFTLACCGRVVDEHGVIRKMFRVPRKWFQDKEWTHLIDCFNEHGGDDVYRIKFVNATTIPHKDDFEKNFMHRYTINK